MRVLARVFGAIAAFFESHASARELAVRMARVEAEQGLLKDQMTQMKTDMAKCKMIVGLNQITDVTPAEV